MTFARAIDGFAGTGESTVAKEVAKRFNLTYIDTGAMYRAVGLYIYLNNISFDDEAVIINCLKNIKIYFDNDNIFLNNNNVTDAIRKNEISDYASRIATYPAVRHKLVKMQQELAENGRVIMEGRDIASHVLPNANIKIYLDASPEERARRRCNQLIEKGQTAVYEDILKETLIRDERDMTRVHAPLIKVSDAILVDTTNMTLGEGIEEIIKIIGDVDVL